jgi:pyruvate, orthophosphate dikinase
VRCGCGEPLRRLRSTVLNLGLNDAIVAEIAAAGDAKVSRWIHDSYRRLIQMFADVVRGVDLSLFEAELARVRRDAHVMTDVELSSEHLQTLIASYKVVYRKETGEEFPQDPWRQLYDAVGAVFRSWNNPRAIKYRQINGIKGLLGTAVNIMAMVYGNKDEESGTGVLFTRNPATGVDELFGEYLFNAQGEDVVSGVRTPKPIAELKDANSALYDELYTMVKLLESHYKDVQDCEFTVQSGRLFMLQTRNGKRTGTAAVRIAVDFVKEGVTSKEDAVARLVTPQHLDQVLHPNLSDPMASEADCVTKGIAASPGAAAGIIVFTAGEAEAMKEKGLKALLVREETSPEDVGGMHAAQGILTARGGMTSHAAVVARAWGKPCVAGAGDMHVDVAEGKAVVMSVGLVLRRGDWITIDGSTGKVYKGKQPMAAPDVRGGALADFMSWVHSIRRMRVKANADTPEDTARAVSFGAEGVGLVRTEHMFFQPDRIVAMRRMILAHTEAESVAALKEIEPLQAGDFEGIFRHAAGTGPVTIRLLDPPLHEFLPQTREQQQQLATLIGVTVEQVRSTVDSLREANPMTGHRGCRLGITKPMITAMQARAIFTAAKAVAEEGKEVIAEVMIPLVGLEKELDNQADIIDKMAVQVFGGGGSSTHDEAVRLAAAAGVTYRVGTMIEVPRACLIAGDLAKKAEFFSVGSNDLTQMTFGYSRDDAGPFVSYYVQNGILPADPFAHIDVKGVAALIAMAQERGKAVRPELKMGVCGEHGGDPESIHVFEDLGLDYVSCSPFRVPIAALAAAQATLRVRKASASAAV